MVVICLILLIVFWYFGVQIIWNHYTAPFKYMKQAKQIKIAKERFEQVISDKEFKKRIEPFNKALNDGKITQEDFNNTFVSLFKERTQELFGEDKS